MEACSINQISATPDGDAGGLGGLKLQFRLGNMVMPLFQIDTATQAYAMVCDALSNISFASCEDPDSLKVVNKLSPNTIAFSDYTREVAATAGFGTGGTLFGITFERSSALNISGSSTNNSRILSLEYSGVKADTFNIVVTVNYLQIANVSTSNVVVNK
jgi:hypothetical protein